MTTKTSWDGTRLADKIAKAAMRGVVRGTERVRAEMVRLVMETSKTGRTYQRRGVVHQASAPGEPPASDTGNFLRNIQTSFDAEEIAGQVNAGARYSAALEFGTQKMEPRPFARPAVENTKAEIQADIANEIAKVLT